MSLLISSVLGLVAGVLTGLIGASGVMVLVPGLILLGYSTFEAIGASLFADAFASLVVAWTYYQGGNLNLQQGWWIAIGSVLGAQIGSMLSPRIPEVGLSNSFGIFLIITAVTFWMRGKKGIIPVSEEQLADGNPQSSVFDFLKKNVVVSGVVLGVLVGIVSGVLGAGGGVMILLILVFLLGYKMHEGIGTSTLIMAVTAGSGGVGHAMTGHLPMQAAIYCALGTVIGGRLAAKYANRVDESKLNKIVGAVFCILGIAMLLAGV